MIYVYSFLKTRTLFDRTKIQKTEILFFMIIIIILSNKKKILTQGN